LGAANLRDIGFQFPDNSNEFLNIDSKILLHRTNELLKEKGYKIGNIDATVAAQAPKLNPHIPVMQETMAKVLGIDPDMLSIKATTTERLGFEGRKEGITAYAVVLIEK
jgi:2-C-methyl-D-erythritol 2,4-cyclodiphosphate synthase